jgi:hypothetical protein
VHRSFARISGNERSAEFESGKQSGRAFPYGWPFTNDISLGLLLASRENLFPLEENGHNLPSHVDRPTKAIVEFIARIRSDFALDDPVLLAAAWILVSNIPTC